MLVAASVAGAFIGIIFSISGGLESSGSDLKSRMLTDIKIINDPSAVANDPVIIYVKNTGEITLNQNQTSILIDGLIYDTNISVVSGDEYWRPGDVLRMTVYTNLTTGDHRVEVITENGISDTMDFHMGGN